MPSAVAIARDDSLQLADVRRHVKAIFIGSVGNLVEWYDFYACAAFALYFAGSFFPGTDPVVQQLNAAILFAFGFIVRPIGGWMFGHLADRHGRRNALMLSVELQSRPASSNDTRRRVNVRYRESGFRNKGPRRL